jgi:hypothetical protein
MAHAPALRVERWTIPAERWIRNELVLVGGLIVLGTLLPLILGGASGALDLPRNDDWSFRRTALELWRTGHLTFDTVAAPILIGQVLLVQPLLWLTRAASRRSRSRASSCPSPRRWACTGWPASCSRLRGRSSRACRCLVPGIPRLQHVVHDG